MKPLKDLSKDLLAATQDGLQEAAEAVGKELVMQSPLWYGDFSDSWVIRINADRPILNNKPERKDRKWNTQPTAVRGRPPIAPRIRSVEKGYRIGNRMEYAGFATDEIPVKQNLFRGDRKGATAPKFWFQKYARFDIDKDLEQGFNASLSRYF